MDVTRRMQLTEDVHLKQCVAKIEELVEALRVMEENQKRLMVFVHDVAFHTMSDHHLRQIALRLVEELEEKK